MGYVQPYRRNQIWLPDDTSCASVAWRRRHWLPLPCGAVQTAPAAEEPAMEEKEAPKEAAQEAPAKELQKLSIHSYGGLQHSRAL